MLKVKVKLSTFAGKKLAQERKKMFPNQAGRDSWGSPIQGKPYRQI